MSHHALRRSFVAFHLILGAVVLVESLMTVWYASGLGHSPHPNPILAVLAGAEAVAALLFILPAALRIGAASLLLIFIFALAFHGLHGELQLTLLVYAAGVMLVTAHGSAFGKGGVRENVAA
jgi:hypothetical protein